MGISKEQRHQAILEILQRTGSSSVAELGSDLGVAEMTVRRDLETLETDGALVRFHGGAKLRSRSGYEPPISIRERSNASQKRAIAHAVANLVGDGETIILDGGSTGIAIAEALVGRALTICPLSLRVAWAFERSTSVNLLFPPGRARAGELSVSGADTIEFLRRHHFDRYLMTASAFSIAHGFTEWNMDDAAVKRAALSCAGIVTASVDSSKFERVGFVEVCDIGTPDQVVVDADLRAVPHQGLIDSARHVEIAD